MRTSRHKPKKKRSWIYLENRKKNKPLYRTRHRNSIQTSMRKTGRDVFEVTVRSLIFFRIQKEVIVEF